MALVKEARPETIAYLLHIVTANAARGRLQHDPQTVSSHGFLYSVHRAVLRISDPFTGNYAKVSLPDPSHPLADAAWDPVAKEATRIVFDQAASDEHTAALRANLVPEPSFVTSTFHLAVALSHFGPLSTVRIYQSQIRDIQEMTKHVSRMRKERESGAWDNPSGQLSIAMLKRFEGQLDKMTSEKLATDAALLDPDFLRHVLRFLDFQMAWLLRVAAESCGAGDSSKVDWNSVMLGRTSVVGGVELSDLGEPDGRWKALPEWMVDDVCEWYTFITR